MKPMKAMHEVIVPAFYALYMYIVFKIILFKFGPIEFGFLWERALRNAVHPGYIRNRVVSGNLRPFETITDTMHSISDQGLLNLFGNIAIFMPLGVFLFAMYRNQGLSCVGVFIRALALSLTLEMLQAFFQIGRFDVDDLILNVFGGLLGYGAVMGLRLGGKLLGMLRVRKSVEG